MPALPVVLEQYCEPPVGAAPLPEQAVDAPSAALDPELLEDDPPEEPELLEDAELPEEPELLDEPELLEVLELLDSPEPLEVLEAFDELEPLDDPELVAAPASSAEPELPDTEPAPLELGPVGEPESSVPEFDDEHAAEATTVAVSIWRRRALMTSTLLSFGKRSLASTSDGR